MKSIPIAACILRFLALSTLLLAVPDCIAAPPAIPRSIRVVMDDNYPPYAFKGDHGQLKGIIVDQWALWEKKTGIHAELTGTDWSEAQRRMRAGEFDVIDMIFRSENREKIYDFTKPYAVISVPLFFHSNISGINGPGDAGGFMVAAKAGDNVIDILRKHGVTNIVEYPSYEKVIEAARDGKVKVFTVDRPPALYFLNKMGIQDRFRETTPLYNGEFHRAVLKGKNDLLATVEKGFAAITPAEYRVIEKKWLGTPLGASPYFRYVGYSAVVIAAFVVGLLAWLWLLKKAVAVKTRKLSESEERFRSIMALSPDIISIIGKDGDLVYTSPSAARTHGYTQDEMLGLTPFDLIHPDDRERVNRAFNELLENPEKIANVPYRYRNKDGSYTWMECRASSQLSNPHISGIIALSRNIEDRKRIEGERLKLEQQLLHAQKLESLGVLAGGIAHDFNNILMTIMGNAGLALMRMAPESPAVDNLHRIENAAAQAADLAKQMLAYSGKGKFVVENINLNRLLEEMLHMLEVSISKSAVLRLNLTKNLPLVEADATQMRQIIMNLVINASEAIGDTSGVIAITTGCMDCDAGYLKDVWLFENITEGLYIYLEIADTGCGMDKETLAKVFDPFFTTKFTGRGLGMAAVLGILRGHKGAIKIYSEPGRGTTFKILLPASNRPAELFNHIDRRDDWRGEGKVLLVDDDETVRGIGSEMLKELGFGAITAKDGREAVSIYKETPDIAVVILDLTMPHMNGEQCFRELRRIKPDVKVIMSSGYNEQEVTQKFVGKGLAGFIQKPYRLSVLKEALQKI